MLRGVPLRATGNSMLQYKNGTHNRIQRVPECQPNEQSRELTLGIQTFTSYRLKTIAKSLIINVLN